MSVSAAGKRANIFGNYVQHIRVSRNTFPVRPGEIKECFMLVGRGIGKLSGPYLSLQTIRAYRTMSRWSRPQLEALLQKTTSFPEVGPKSVVWWYAMVLFALCADKEDEDGGIITLEELKGHMNDLQFLHDLTAASVVCPGCKNRLVVDNQKFSHKMYCYCPTSVNPADNVKRTGAFKDWSAFVETKDLLIWRKPLESNPSLYIYKVFGRYEDISPMDFLNTQLDIEGRRKWDDTAVKLHFIDKDESKQIEFVYWEMDWPRLMSNRDYVFARRHIIYKDSGDIVMISKATVHPAAPELSGIVRVKEYWSVMHIKALKGLEKPGVEFGLTYYDNPGLSLPKWLMNWASMTAIPGFLDKSRNAARARKNSIPAGPSK